MLSLKEILPPIEKLKPSEDCILWRYMDIPSLIEILNFEYLPLIKVSCLSDPAEGAILKFALNKFRIAEDFGKKFVFDIYKTNTFVSCWCEYEEELAPMWERFSTKDGVAIKTNAKLLLENLTTQGTFDIKYVKYIDRNPDEIFEDITDLDSSDLNSIERYLFFYKLSDFSDEREVRILKSITPWNIWGLLSADGVNQNLLEQMRGNYLTPKKDIYEAGIVSIIDFITEIIISPTAHPGIFKIVERLLRNLNEIRTFRRKPIFDIDVKDSRRKIWF